MPITMMDTVDFNEVPSVGFALPIVAADPVGYEAGLIYNSTTDEVKYHNGTTWVAVSVVGHTHPSTTDFWWTYDNVETMADPGAGDIRTNTISGTPSTQAAVSKITARGIDATDTLKSLAIGDLIYFQQKDDAGNWGRYTISAAPVNNGTWWLLPIAAVEQHGSPIAKNQEVLVKFTYGTGGGGGGSGTGGHVIQDEGSTLATRSKLNFIGAGVAATDDAVSDRTNITVTNPSIIEGTWWFANAGSAVEPLYAAGAIWNKVTSPSHTQKYMIAAVDWKGVDHITQFTAVVPGDELLLTWIGNNFARRTIRSVTYGYSGGSTLTHLILGTSGLSGGSQVPGGQNGQAIQAAIVPQRLFTHGSYFLGVNTIAPHGHVSWNADPQTSPSSVTQLAISTRDLSGQGSELKLWASPIGSKISIGLDQGGRVEFTTTGALSSRITDSTNGDYYTLPVTTTSFTGFYGNFGWLNVLPAVAGMGAIAYRHVQASAATMWSIAHTLSYRPAVTAVDSTGREMLPGEVLYVSDTTIQLTFSSAVGGEAYLT